MQESPPNEEWQGGCRTGHPSKTAQLTMCVIGIPFYGYPAVHPATYDTSCETASTGSVYDPGYLNRLNGASAYYPEPLYHAWVTPPVSFQYEVFQSVEPSLPVTGDFHWYNSSLHAWDENAGSPRCATHPGDPTHLTTYISMPLYQVSSCTLLGGLLPSNPQGNLVLT